MEIGDLKQTLLSVGEMLGKEIDGSKIEILDRGIPHVSRGLPKGKMAIYMFEYKGTFLKIGKVGANSNARFLSQHYNPNSSQSNLAKSVMLDKDMTDKGIGESDIKSWLLKHTRRIDILLDIELGIFTLNLMEACLHFKYSPKYEGFANQKGYVKK